MAIKSTVYKAKLDVVDIDRGHYADYRLTLACHSSETEERLMVRLLVFALNAHERLEFGKGISDSDEPDLWLKDLTGDVELWVELGHPDERVVVRACGRSKAVRVYTYSASPERWWEPVRARLSKERKLEVFHIDADDVKALGAFAERDMEVQVTVQDGAVWVRDAAGREQEIRIRPAE